MSRCLRYGLRSPASCLLPHDEDGEHRFEGRAVVTDEEYEMMIVSHHEMLTAMAVPRENICNRCMSPVYDDRCYWPLRLSAVP